MHTPLTRRSILGLALAGAAGASTFRVSPAEAAKLLDAPATDPVPQLGQRLSTDPAEFAAYVDSDISGRYDWEEFIGTIAPEAHAAYVQARAAFIQAYPQFTDAILSYRHPFALLDEAAFDWPCDAYMAGLRAGAAYEHLRLALVPTTRVCGACQGIGSLRDGTHSRAAGSATPCPSCGGSGLVEVTR